MKMNRKTYCWIWIVWAPVLAALFAAGCEQAGPGSGGGDRDEEFEFEEEEEKAPVITGITLLSLPDTTIYGRDAAFDPAGLVVAWTWDNGETTKILAGEYTLTQPDMAKFNPQILTVEIPAGEYTLTPPTPPDMTGFSPRKLTVSAGEYSATFAISVMDSGKVLESITVSGPANKVNRFGSDFDRTGFTVTAHYSNKTIDNVTSYTTILGYDKRKRGAQDVSVRVNGKTASVPGISVRIPSDMTVTLKTNNSSMNEITTGYRRVYIEGESIDMRYANFHADAVTASGTITISYGMENLFVTDTVSGFYPNTPGRQKAVLHLDDKAVEFDVSVVYAAPEVWFDYGYRRGPDDSDGKGPGAGKYYAKAGETLVLAPVRFLVGYDRDHKDTGAGYSWSVSGGSFSSPATATGEFYSFTPTAAGTSTITVTVTGNNYITGTPVTKTATTQVVCYTGAVSSGASWSLGQRLLHHAPGQYATGGNGYGWSLGSFGGYEVWRVNHQAVYNIRGNAFSSWAEPGVIWIQEDSNGNGVPDEMWYELKGSMDYLTSAEHKINRRHAITYINDKGVETRYGTGGEPSPRKYWVDSRGRAGLWPSEWHSGWPQRITFTGTLFGDASSKTPSGGGADDAWGYVDVYGPAAGHGPPGDIHPPAEFPIHRAMRADGSAITLTNVSFIKVHTSEFCKTEVFGDKSTEIYSADYLGRQTDFPLPEDS
jgi:hypothetical protein